MIDKQTEVVKGMKKVVFFLITLSVGTVMHGQQGSPSLAPSAATAPNPAAALPPGPLLKPLPDGTRCTLTIVNRHPKPAASESVPKKAPKTGKSANRDSTVMMIGETMGKSAHLSIVQNNGSREEQWTDGNLLAIMNSGANALTFSDESIDKVPTPDWVSPENFAELRRQGNKSYLVFRDRVLPAGTEVVRDLEAEAQGQTRNLDELKVNAIALIDAETRLPFSVEEGETTTAYKFEALAPDAQIIPAAVQASLAQRGQKMQEAVSKQVRP